MKVKKTIRRVLTKAVQRRNVMEKSRTLILNLSPTHIDIDEAATIAFNARTIRSRYNKKRDLLMLEFDTPQDKLRYLKRLPQSLWNRNCVVFDYPATQLELWRLESLG